MNGENFHMVNTVVRLRSLDRKQRHTEKLGNHGNVVLEKGTEDTMDGKRINVEVLQRMETGGVVRK